MKMHAGVARESFRYPAVARQKRNLESVRIANLQWARKFGLIPSEQALVKIEAIQIEQMAAAVYPEASKQVLALCTDLLLWFFISDDQYDERALGADPMRMEQITNDFMQVLRTPPPPHIYRQVTGRFRFALGGCHAYRDTGTRAKESEVASGAGVGVVE